MVLLTPNFIEAFEFSNFKFNVGYIGYTGYAEFSKETCLKSFFEIDLCNFGFEFDTGIGYTQLGLEISPIKFWLYGDDENHFGGGDEFRYSFFNFGIYWKLFDGDIFQNNTVEIILFNKINYIYTAEKFHFKWDEYIYSAGIRTVLTYDHFYNLFNIELGYRSMNRKNGLYTNVNIDIGALFIIWLKSESNKEKKEE